MPLWVTTSWDDAQPADLRIAEMLDRHGVKGTFYAPRDYRRALSEAELRELGAKHEIGAHTLAHVDLTTLSPERLREEVAGSRGWLQDVLGRDVPMFCYPLGRFNDAVKDEVRRAGFAGARTVAPWIVERPRDPFEMGTTLHVYPHPLRRTGPWTPILSWKVFDPLRKNREAIGRFRLSPPAICSWWHFASRLFDAIGGRIPSADSRASIPACREGEGRLDVNRDGQEGRFSCDADVVFHLWGHGWEVDKYALWRPLERLLRRMSERGDVRFVTNGALLGPAEVAEDAERRSS